MFLAVGNIYSNNLTPTYTTQYEVIIIYNIALSIVFREYENDNCRINFIGPRSVGTLMHFERKHR